MSTCRASRTRLRRHRRRRWIARRSAFISQPPPPRTIGQPILYSHSGPAHLTRQDLAICGLTPTGKKPLSYDTKPTHLTDSDLPALALAWR